MDEMVRILLDHCGVTNHSLWTLLYGDVEMRRQVHMSFDALLHSISISISINSMQGEILKVVRNNENNKHIRLI